MIAAVSILLASYEAFAMTTHRKTVTDYSHTYPWGFLVYGWLIWLAVHFIREASKETHRGY